MRNEDWGILFFRTAEHALRSTSGNVPLNCSLEPSSKSRTNLLPWSAKGLADLLSARPAEYLRDVPHIGARP